MTKFIRILLIVALGMMLAWGALTIWVEREGPAETWTFGSLEAPKKCLIVFDPDPIYDLDQQVCLAVAEELSKQDYFTRVVTVAAWNKSFVANYDLYLVCANTYNWRPDWAIVRFVKSIDLNGRNVAALTLGAGSTGAAQRHFESIVRSRNVNLVSSRSLWLLRPNDEVTMEESNVVVAKEIAEKWGRELMISE